MRFIQLFNCLHVHKLRWNIAAVFIYKNSCVVNLPAQWFSAKDDCWTPFLFSIFKLLSYSFMYIYIYILLTSKNTCLQSSLFEVVFFLFILIRFKFFFHNKRVAFASVQFVLILAFVCASNLASARLACWADWLVEQLASQVSSFRLAACIVDIESQLHVALKLSQNISGNSFWVASEHMLFQRDDL